MRVLDAAPERYPQPGNTDEVRAALVVVAHARAQSESHARHVAQIVEPGLDAALRAEKLVAIVVIEIEAAAEETDLRVALVLAKIQHPVADLCVDPVHTQLPGTLQRQEVLVALAPQHGFRVVELGYPILIVAERDVAIRPDVPVGRHRLDAERGLPVVVIVMGVGVVGENVAAHQPVFRYLGPIPEAEAGVRLLFGVVGDVRAAIDDLARILEDRHPDPARRPRIEGARRVGALVLSVGRRLDADMGPPLQPLCLRCADPAQGRRGKQNRDGGCARGGRGQLQWHRCPSQMI